MSLNQTSDPSYTSEFAIGFVFFIGIGPLLLLSVSFFCFLRTLVPCPRVKVVVRSFGGQIASAILCESIGSKD
jgi:hypothetical protein